jgi:crossover junction endodeoxyribonuclease RuvC
LGFGVIDSNGAKQTMVTAGVIRTPAHTPLVDRLAEIFDGLTDIIRETKPERIAVEKLFFNTNITTAINVAQARGVVLLVAKQAELILDEYTPLEIKKTLTGYGRADKKQVQEMVRLQLGLREVPKPDDCADALAAALMSAFINRY